MNVSWAMSGTRSTSRTMRPISLSIRRWYLTTSISKALTSPCLTRSTSGASASGAFIQQCAGRPSAKRAATRRRRNRPRSARRATGDSRPRRCTGNQRLARRRSPRRSSRNAPRSMATSSGPVAARRRSRQRTSRRRPGSQNAAFGPRQRQGDGDRPGAQATASATAGARAGHRRRVEQRQGPGADRRDRDAGDDRDGRRQTPKRRSLTSKKTLSRMAGAEAGAQARLKTRVPLVPPNPKLFLTACSIFIGRASLAQ